MTAAIDLIKQSLFKLGVNSEIKPVSPEMLSYSFTTFQGFVKSLKDRGFDRIGIVVPQVLADEVSERGGSTDYITAIFAKKMASHFQKDVTPQLMMEASKAEEELERHYRSLDIPSSVPSSPRLLGQGNRRRFR